jgi:16S rRNA (guanine966-N2)-methyltransferase
MVENDRHAFRALGECRELLRATQIEVVFGDAMDYLRTSKDAFDVVFLDPPFRQNALAPALEQLPGRVPAGGRVYVEAPAPLELQAPWRELKRARAGQVSYQLLEKQ